LQLKHQTQHCWTISFPPYVPNEWCYSVGMALCDWFRTGHAATYNCYQRPKIWQITDRFKVKTKAVCRWNTKHGTAKSYHFLHMCPISDVTVLGWLCVTDFGQAIHLRVRNVETNFLSLLTPFKIPSQQCYMLTTIPWCPLHSTATDCNKQQIVQLHACNRQCAKCLSAALVLYLRHLSDFWETHNSWY
jgi:hypothetical protein